MFQGLDFCCIHLDREVCFGVSKRISGEKEAAGDSLTGVTLFDFSNSDFNSDLKITVLQNNTV